MAVWRHVGGWGGSVSFWLNCSLVHTALSPTPPPLLLFSTLSPFLSPLFAPEAAESILHHCQDLKLRSIALPLLKGIWGVEKYSWIWLFLSSLIHKGSSCASPSRVYLPSLLALLTLKGWYWDSISLSGMSRGYIQNPVPLLPIILVRVRLRSQHSITCWPQRTSELKSWRFLSQADYKPANIQNCHCGAPR